MRVRLEALLPAAAVLVLLAGCVPGDEPESADVPSWVPPVALPPRAEDAGRGVASLTDPEWVARVSDVTGIPERQLASYAGVAIWKSREFPECALSWPTLAGIAAVESDHGRHGGASVASDGRVTPPIVGIALDGSETDLIPDSDGGELDGDAEFDRAVGPFQLIPQSWRNWNVDGNGDGVMDPHNIDDAALAAANYLCRASSPQDTEEGWRAAIAAYNSAPSYLDAVTARAAEYAAVVADDVAGE